MPAKNAMSSLPFGNAVGEGFDLMKKMWGMTGLPGIPNPGNLAQMATRLPQALPNMIAPTLDIDELDKRIADLRAVEQWLQLNAAMLRTTIQSLEVQRATIATLKQVSGAMLSPMIGKPEAATAAPSFAIPPTPAAATTTTPAPVRRSAKRSRRTTPPHAPKASEAPLNPAAWWNTLQDQFTKIAAAATAGAESGAAAAKAPPSRKRRAPPQKS
ncbi:MAG: alginate biosynthesis protein AlgP [Burkholderiaceae bacterium]|nr:alginate biosynthesis protein AlgP [Burkholderiaceae bacterium]